MIPGRRTRSSVLMALAGLFAVVAGQAMAAPADRDPDFGEGGIVYSGFEPGSTPSAGAEAVEVQADGKLVVAGAGGGGIALARYNADGSLDESFDDDGLQVIGPIGQGASALDLAMGADGDLLLAGRTADFDSDVESDFLLARVNGDGSLDEDFGDGGIVATDFGASSDRANGIDLAADGHIVVAGRSERRYALARYTNGGALDETFGSDGLVLGPLEPTGGFDDVVIQSDGRIVAADGRIVAAGTAASMTRFDADGSLDESFGVAGSVRIADHSGGSLLLDANDGLVVGGSAGTDFRISRYGALGAPDTEFNMNAARPVLDDGHARGAGIADLALDAEGRIVAAGYWTSTQSGGDQAGLARYLPNGSPDPTFGVASRGLQGGDVEPGLVARSVTTQPDGAIVATGAGSPVRGDALFATIRLQGGTVADDPPDTEISSPADGEVVRGGVRLRFKGTDDFTPAGDLTFECKRNRLRWRPCTTPRFYTDLRPGPHRFAVRAIDSNPLPDPEPAVVHIRVRPER